MERKKINLAEMAVDASKTMSDIWGKTKDTVIKAVDQNDDGAFDMKDVSAITGTIEHSARTAIAAVKDGAEARSRETKRRQLQPLFVEDLESPNFSMTKLICVTEMDKKRADSEICQGSIGFTSKLKDMRVINIYKDKINDFGISFYKDVDLGLYYCDPSDRDFYISIEDYFEYVKIARLNELQKIAQSLGAKHFRATYREEKSTETGMAVKAKASGKVLKKTSGGEVEHNHAEKESSSFKYYAENTFPGHAPEYPKLCYLKHDPCIINLIELRMDPSSPMGHQAITIQLSNSSGIKEKDAVKIDAAMKVMKISSTVSMVTEAKKEANQYFEYEIDF